MTPSDDELNRADVLRAFDVSEDDMQAFEDATHDYTAVKEQVEAERKAFTAQVHEQLAYIEMVLHADLRHSVERDWTKLQETTAQPGTLADYKRVGKP